MQDAAAPRPSISPSARLWPLLGFIVLVLLPAARTFAVQPFNLPSGSMEPTLLIGDYVFVAKYAYGYSRYSLPFSPPLFEGRILATEPQRGDLVVFRLPRDDQVDYIKRVVGLPGDRIQMRNGELYINGAPVKRERIADFVERSGGKIVRVKRWRETLPNGASYETLDLTDNGFLDNTPEYLVSTGHYFMLGDNRDNSTDSRVLSQVGYVPFANLIGRVGMIFYSVDRESEPGQERPRMERIGAIAH
jgi:signal peptidase I